jgi:hypothetical protein
MAQGNLYRGDEEQEVNLLLENKINSKNQEDKTDNMVCKH